MLNETQQKIYNFLLERLQDGVPPSIREIGAHVGLKSTSSVQASLDALENEGFISRDPLLKRSIRIVGQEDLSNIKQVPILGTVTAGAPILAVEQIEGYLPYAGFASKDKSLFALRVRGESMLNAGIHDGDLVVVERTPVARNGEIIVALVGDEATVKTYSVKNGQVWLLPENEEFSPIDGSNAMILGKVVATMRYYQ